jgi:hypothetical protein
MRTIVPATVLALGVAVSPARARIEAPYSLGQMCKESAHIVVLEIVRVNRDKNLIFFKTVAELKGKHPGGEIRHHICKREDDPREWQNVMEWAAVGKRAVFFHNGHASLTCIGTYWYQCYRRGAWWGMSRAQPYLLRTYHGEAEPLTAALARVLRGEEVVIPCLRDGDKEALHLRKGRLQFLRASLKRDRYDAERDFVRFGDPPAEPSAGRAGSRPR